MVAAGVGLFMVTAGVWLMIWWLQGVGLMIW